MSEDLEASLRVAVEALEEIADPTRYHKDDWGVSVMYGTRLLAQGALDFVRARVSEKILERGAR